MRIPSGLFPMRSRRNAFTLIELLTVIAIIGILAAIIIPTVGKVKRTAKKAQCVSRMRQWGSAIALQANDAKTKVILGFLKDGSGSYVLDTYLNYGGENVVEASRTDAANLRKGVDGFALCPTYVNNGQTLPKYQYGFVVPIGATISTPILGIIINATYSYSTTNASSPSRLLLMVEVKNGATLPVVKAVGDIKTFLDDPNSVRSLQNNDGYDRHGGNVNALFLDGHVSSLSPTETDYANSESRTKLERYFTLR